MSDRREFSHKAEPEELIGAIEVLEDQIPDNDEDSVK